MVELSLAIIVASLPGLKELLLRDIRVIKIGSTTIIDLEDVKLVESGAERKSIARQV